MSGNAEAAGHIITKGSAYTASGALTLFGGLTAQEWAAIVGIVLAFATFAVNWYYQHRRTQLAVESLDLRREKSTDEDHTCT